MFDTDGVTRLAFNDDTAFSGDAFGAGDPESFDSTLFGLTLPADGTYFLRADAFGTGTGDYELLLATTLIPEPAALLLLAAAGLAAAGRRRRRTRFAGSG